MDTNDREVNMNEQEAMYEEYGFLVGAKIVGIEMRDDSVGIGTALALHLLTRDPVSFSNTDDPPSKNVVVEVWRDEEGNAPGYLALTKIETHDEAIGAGRVKA